MTAGLGPLDVDGPRPAVAWVSQLPRTWLLIGDRALLLVLALDTYDQVPPFTCQPSTAKLWAWTGDQSKGTLLERIARLAGPVDGVRPALIEVTKGAGKRPSVYRLRTEVGPSLWSGRSDRYESASGLADRTTTSGLADRTASPRSGPASGPASGLADRTAPFPTPTSTHPPYLPHGDARENDTGSSPTRHDEHDRTAVLRRVRERTGVDLSGHARDVDQQLAAGWAVDDLVHIATDRGTTGLTQPAAGLAARIRAAGPPPPRRPRCPHGRPDGERIVGTGAHASRVCPACEHEHPATEAASA